MLGIILLIIKCIGILLATVIGIILLLLLLVLFFPFTYKLNGEVHNKLETLNVEGSCKWFLGLLRVHFRIVNMKIQWDGHILWFDIRKILGAEEDEKEVKTEPIEEVVTEEIVEEKIKIEEIDIEESATQAEDKKKKITKNKKTKHEKSKKKEKQKVNISQTIRNICDKIKLLREKKDKIIAFYYVDVHQYTLSKLKTCGMFLWRRLKPSKFAFQAHIGFEDPSITGKFLAFMSLLYPFYGNAIEIRPEFEDVIYEGEMNISGFLQLYPFIYVIIKLILDKKVRQTYKNIRSFEL